MRLPIRNVHSVGVLAILTITAIVASVTLLIFGLRDRELRHASLEMVTLTKMLMEQTEQNIKSADLALQRPIPLRGTPLTTTKSCMCS